MKTQIMKIALGALCATSAFHSAQTWACSSDVRLYPSAARERNAWAKVNKYITAEEEILYNDMRVYVVFKQARWPMVPIIKGGPHVKGLQTFGLCEALPSDTPQCSLDRTVISNYGENGQPRNPLDRFLDRARWAEKCYFISTLYHQGNHARYRTHELFPTFSGTPDAPVDPAEPCPNPGEIAWAQKCHYGQTSYMPFE